MALRTGGSPKAAVEKKKSDKIKERENHPGGRFFSLLRMAPIIPQIPMDFWYDKGLWPAIRILFSSFFVVIMGELFTIKPEEIG